MVCEKSRFSALTRFSGAYDVKQIIIYFSDVKCGVLVEINVNNCRHTHTHRVAAPDFFVRTVFLCVWIRCPVCVSLCLCCGFASWLVLCVCVCVCVVHACRSEDSSLRLRIAADVVRRARREETQTPTHFDSLTHIVVKGRFHVFFFSAPSYMYMFSEFNIRYFFQTYLLMIYFWF